MSITPVTYYTAGCDVCLQDFNEDSDYSAWSDPNGALETALDSCALEVKTIDPADESLLICDNCALELGKWRGHDPHEYREKITELDVRQYAAHEADRRAAQDAGA